MNETLKKILSYGGVGGLGYYLGLKNNERPKTSLFSRFIPTVIFTSALAYFLINVPKSFIGYLEKRNDNYTKIEVLKIDKGYEKEALKLKEMENKQKQLEEKIENKQNKIESIYQKSVEDLLKFSSTNNEKINTLDRKVDELKSSINNISKDKVKSENIAYENPYLWLVFDKSDQMYYLYDQNKLIKSGLMIFNKEKDKPFNGIYNVREIKNKSGDLYPGFITLEGVVGISGAGDNNDYRDAILESKNITRNGFRILNEDMDYLMSKLNNYTRVEVRD